MRKRSGDKFRGVGAGGGQEREEALEALRVVPEGGWQLPENRPEFLLEFEQSGREEIGERRTNVTEPQHMRNEARPLDGEDEIRRSFAVPARVVFGTLQRIETPVDLDRFETLRGVREFLLAGQTDGIELAAPSGISPAGDANSRMPLSTLFRPGAHYFDEGPRTASSYFKVEYAQYE